MGEEKQAPEKDAVKGYKGVQSVKRDCDANKVTMVGKVDPVKMKGRLEEKTKKKVELISPQPKKDAAAGGGDKKPEEKKPEEKKPEEKKPPKESTDVLKISLHPEICRRSDDGEHRVVDEGKRENKKDDRGKRKGNKADDRSKKKDDEGNEGKRKTEKGGKP